MAAHREHAARLGEPRWIPAAALILFIGLNVALRLWLPHSAALRLPWLVPAVEGVLLVVLVFGDPGNLAKHHKLFRRISVTLVVALVAAALWATVFLISDLVKGTGVTSSATKLLHTGALIWLGNNPAFAPSG